MTTTRQNVVMDTSVKPQLRNGSRTCQCAGCGLFFTGVAPFDRHLIGIGTGCYCVEEMYTLGMMTNEHGVWMYGTSKKHLPAGTSAA